MGSTNVEHELGIFSQLSINTYTTIVLGFHIQPELTKEQILQTLNKATLELFAAIPFLSGRVVCEGETSTRSGTYRIVSDPTFNSESPVRCKDCTQLLPSYDEILRAKAPFFMLDGDIICPVRGFGYEYSKDDYQPVMIVQANFVRGGLLLCFACQHNALDMNGQGVVIRHFAAAARGDEFEPALIKAALIDTSSVVPLLEKEEPAADLYNMLRPSKLKPDTNVAVSHSKTEAASWKYWRFSADKLAELKSMAISDSGITASINDIVTAFCMQRITAARIKAGNVVPDEDVTLHRAVDGRRKLNPQISSGYLHHMVLQTDTTWKAHSISASPLSTIAVDLRKSLQMTNDNYVRSLATLISTTEDKTTIFYGATTKPGRDIMISSWVALGLATSDFGPNLGLPNFCRRPLLDQLAGVAYLLPKTIEGHIDLGLCILQSDSEALENDNVWRSFVEFIG